MRQLRRLAACLTTLCALAFSVQSVTALAYVEATVTIPVSCLNVTAGSDHIYEILIERENNFSPMPLSDTLHITEDGTGEFTITLNEPGNFEYRIYEKPGEDEKIQYDDTLYEVTVYVTCEVDDVLQYAVTVLDHSSGKKPEKLEFQNAVFGETDVHTTTAPPTTDDSYTGTNTRSTDDDSFTDVNTTESNPIWDDSYTDVNTSIVDTPPGAPSDTQNSQSSLHSSTTVNTQTVTTTAPPDPGTKPTLAELAGSVLTGDNAPLTLLFGAMSAAALTGGVTLLLKRREDDFDDDND